MSVEVYWNLHKGGYSVRERGRVIDHTDSVTVRDARFVVQLGGHARVVRERCRMVHAMVRGERIASAPKPARTVTVHYNPYRADYFHTASGARVDAAPVVWFSVRNGKPVVEIAE